MDHKTRDIQVTVRGSSDRSVEFVASSPGVARDGGIIEPGAWRTENFEKNPVFLWAHQKDQLPIGRVTSIKAGDDGLRATVEFAGDDEAHPHAETVKRLYKGGFLNSVSVGFDVTADRKPTPEERKAGARWVATSAELYEISAVPVPADVGAVATKRIRAAGLTDEDARTLEVWAGIPAWIDLAERIRDMPDDIKARQDEDPVEDEEEVEDQEPEASEDEEKGGAADFMREAAEMIATTGAALVEIGGKLREMVGDDEEEEDDSPEEDADDEDMDDEEEEEGRTAQSLLVIRKDLKGLKEAVRALLKAGKVSAPARSKASADAGADADPFNQYADIYG